jgi:acyl-CoA synthetase (AMP-forming)/AMP-acid ligase II
LRTAIRPPRYDFSILASQPRRQGARLGGGTDAQATHGGFNVYSTEVEQALMQHPAVADCAVIGLPDEKWGERVTAVVQLRPGQSASGPELAAFVKERIGSVKSPKQVEVWADLPRSKVGKVLKTDIKASLLDAD